MCFPEGDAARAPGRWCDECSTLRAKVLVLVVGLGSGARQPVSRESIALISVALSPLKDVQGFGDTMWPDALRDRAYDDRCGYAG